MTAAYTGDHQCFMHCCYAGGGLKLLVLISCSATKALELLLRRPRARLLHAPPLGWRFVVVVVVVGTVEAVWAVVAVMADVAVMAVILLVLIVTILGSVDQSLS